MWFTMTQEMIDNAQPGCFYCPVALALAVGAPLAPGVMWSVGLGELGVAKFRNGVLVVESYRQLYRVRYERGWAWKLTAGGPYAWLHDWVAQYDSWSSDRDKAKRAGEPFTQPAPGPFCFEVPDEVVRWARKVA